MAAALKKAKEWEVPTLAIEIPENISLLSSANTTTRCLTLELFDGLIEGVLGPKSTGTDQMTPSEMCMPADVDEACANLLMDMDYITNSDDSPKPTETKQLLKNAQPFRERPSKDRSRRFIVNELPFNTKC